MDRILSHPYVTALVVTGVLLLFGGIVVKNKTAVQTQNTNTLVWSSNGSLLDPTASIPKSDTAGETIYSDVRSGPPFSYNPISVTIPSANSLEGDVFDFDAFLASLSQPLGASPGDSGGGETSFDAYSFIPGGLISTSTSRQSRTPTQQAIYSYGNEVGNTIQSHESSFRSAPQILKNQFEDRGDSDKNQALLALAESMTRTGRTLEGMQAVPPEIVEAHAKLAASYKEMGEKLARMPGAKGDSDFLSLALSYNGAVEAYVKNYVSLATLISTYGVTFTSDNPGSIFTFVNASL